MVLVVQHLWGHIAGSAWSVLRVIDSENSCDAEVSDSKIAIVRDNKVFGLDISVDDLVDMYVLKTCYQARHKEPRDVLVEAAMLRQMVPQVAPRQVVHHQVQILTVLKRIMHINNVHILQLGENLSLVYNRFDRSFVDDPCLWHFFHSVEFFVYEDLPYFSEASFANAQHIAAALLRQDYRTDY